MARPVAVVGPGDGRDVDVQQPRRFIPNIKFLHALIVGACVTPTDPVLSNSIV